ncbi:depupylase/deamidase Dop [Corynebacterium guangdongense]|uniref:Proteasome accessory factor A n=1 Tax=Corynebacterium guangdongense TaxID=1783348 RepID=A0ABU1ZWQ7_9CORY|nr:depupylase/deamidase Dop [Corynebacterium guangdongense]MDR7329340.1 proteasome accessory factor A [Corynebacterium guangdongense]WJZ17905.1 Pup deamidase/depupylase [Corynebacterium guangdongense]
MARYLGTETEYGITCEDPSISPIVTSTHAVVAYASLHTGARSRWDYAGEAPLKDTRGFDLRRYSTTPVVDPDAIGVANVVLPNGARYYVDHAHPEYSSPECANAWDAMVWDAAGDVILNQAAQDIAGLWEKKHSVLAGHDPCPPLKFYKNNVDGKGASYGSHENYQFLRTTDFDGFARALIPFFTTRQIYAGAGRVGIGPAGEVDGFQISQRADYFEQEISLETTLNRGIVNTRDEPHADFLTYRRLHVIVGDANMSQYSNFLKLGATSLVIDAIEEGVDFSDLRLRDAVTELRHVSRDLDCVHELELADGRRLTAREIQREYLARVTPRTSVDKQVVELWGRILDMLADPLSTRHLLDWTAKYALVKGYVDRGVAWSDAKLKLIDLQYADIDPSRSLYHALVRKQRMETLVSPAEIHRAAAEPPADSRAWARGKISEAYARDITSASWQLITFADGTRVELIEVDGSTREEVEAAGGLEAWVASRGNI